VSSIFTHSSSTSTDSIRVASPTTDTAQPPVPTSSEEEGEAELTVKFALALLLATTSKRNIALESKLNSRSSLNWSDCRFSGGQHPR